MNSRAIRWTRKHLNAYLWTKQGLGNKKSPTTVEVAQRHFGIYGSAPTCQFSLLARIPNLRLDHLDREIVERRSLVRVHAMGAAPFLIPTTDLPMVYQATSGQAEFGKILRKMGISGELYTETAERVMALLAKQGHTATELRAAIEPEQGPLHEAFPFLVSRMCAEGRLIRTRARGGWKSDRFEYALMRDWLPDTDLHAMNRHQARCELARRYFAAHGPATADDFQRWSGLTNRHLDAVVDSLGEELVEVDILGLRGRYLALAQERRALERRSAPAPKGIALLPARDTYLLAHQERKRYLDPEWHDRVIDPAGNATSSVFWNGHIVGIWDFEELEKRLRVKLALLTDLPPAGWKTVRGIGTRMARLIGKKDLVLERCPPPRPLSEGRRNPYLAPLKGVSGTTV